MGRIALKGVIPERSMVLTAAHGKMCDTVEYRIFLNSFRAHARPGTELVVLTGNMSDGAKSATREVATLIELDGNFSDRGNKQRHWYFAEYLAGDNERPFSYALTVDSRDTVFQRDPFEWYRTQPPRITMSTEPCRVSQEAWNRKDNGTFQTEIRPPCRSKQDWQVINGGFVIGYYADMVLFQLTRFAMDVRSGNATDQASLTALGNWVRDWPMFSVMPYTEPFVFHGHHISKGVEWFGGDKPLFDPDKCALMTPDRRVYTMFHQYDRSPLKDDIIRRYG